MISSKTKMTGRWNNGQSDFNCYGGMTCEYQVKVKSWERLFILMSFLLDAQHNLLFSNSYLTQLPVFYLLSLLCILPTVAFFKDLQHCTTKLDISSAKIKNRYLNCKLWNDWEVPLLVYLRISICNVNQMAMAFRHATITSTVELNKNHTLTYAEYRSTTRFYAYFFRQFRVLTRVLEN